MLKTFLKKLLTQIKSNDKIRKSLRCDRKMVFEN